MNEVGKRRPLVTVPNQPGRKIQVVVLEEHNRVGLPLEPREHRLRERFVDGDVPVLPGGAELRTQRRSARKIEEEMLKEPERRVGDDVVEAVESLGVVHDQPQAVQRSVARALLDSVTASLSRDNPVLVAHGARDPGDVVVPHQTAKRGGEPAGATAHDPGAALVPGECRGAPVRDQNELTAARAHAPQAAATTTRSEPACSSPSSRLKSASQSLSRRGVRK